MAIPETLFNSNMLTFVLHFVTHKTDVNMYFYKNFSLSCHILSHDNNFNKPFFQHAKALVYELIAEKEMQVNIVINMLVS